MTETHDLRYPIGPFRRPAGLGPEERERMVAEFQSPDGPPLLIVSLRAGGTGLNLTRATAVIHYDRWWNPAVEDQASGRGSGRMPSAPRAIAARISRSDRIMRTPRWVRRAGLA